MGTIKSRFKIVITGLLIVATVVTSSISSLALRADLGDGYQSEVYGFDVGESGVYLEKDAVDADGNPCGDIIHVPAYIGHGEFLGELYELVPDRTEKFFNGKALRAIYFSNYLAQRNNYDEWGDERQYARGKGYYHLEFEGYNTPQEYLDDLYTIGWKELNEIIDLMPEEEKVKRDETYCNSTIKAIDTYLAQQLIDKGVITEDGEINSFTVDNSALKHDEYLKEYNNMFNDKEVDMWFQPLGSTFSEAEQTYNTYELYYNSADHMSSLFNTVTVKIDETLPIFEIPSSDPTLITSARGDEIQVGDYLAPGALIYNTYNEDTDTTQKYILYEAPQTKKKVAYQPVQTERIDIDEKVDVDFTNIDINKTEDYYTAANGIVTKIKLSDGSILICKDSHKEDCYQLSKYDNSYDENLYLCQSYYSYDGNIYSYIVGVYNEETEKMIKLEDIGISEEIAAQIAENNEVDKVFVSSIYGSSPTLVVRDEWFDADGTSIKVEYYLYEDTENIVPDNSNENMLPDNRGFIPVYSSFFPEMTEDYQTENGIVTQIKLSNGAILDYSSHEETYIYYLSQYDSSYNSRTELQFVKELNNGEMQESMYIYGLNAYKTEPIEDTTVDIEFARQIIENNEADSINIVTNYKNDEYNVERKTYTYKDSNGEWFVSYSNNGQDTYNYFNDFEFNYDKTQSFGKELFAGNVSIQDKITGEVFSIVKEGCYGNHFIYSTNIPNNSWQTIIEFDCRFYSCDPEDPILSWGDFGQVDVYMVPTGTRLGKIAYENSLTYVFCSPFGNHYPLDGYQSEDVYAYLIDAPNMDSNVDTYFVDESYAVAKLHEGYFEDPVQVSNIYSYDEFTAKYGLSEGNQLPDGEIIGKDYIIPNSFKRNRKNTPKLSGYPDGYFDNVTFIELTSTNGTRISGAGVAMGTHNGNESDEAKQNAVQTDASIPHTFTVMIPKKIVLDGHSKSADYTVSVTGDIAGDETVVVKPKTTVTFSQEGKEDVIATITQEKTQFTSADLSAATPADGSVLAEGLSAGVWNGTFQFSIALE